MYATTLRETIEVRRPLADCFRYLQDFSTIEQWDPGVYRAEKRTPGPVAVGSEFQLQLAGLAGRTPMRYRLVGLQRDAWLRLSGIADDILADDFIQLSAVDAGRTRIDYEARLQLLKLPRPAGFLLQPALLRLGRRAVEGLKAALELPDARAPEAPRLSLSQRLVLPAALGFTERGYLAMPRKAHSRYMDGKTVLVTGPTGGIGLAAACELSRLGAKLVLVGRGARRLEAAAEAIEAFAGSPHGIRLIEADLSEPAQLEQAAARVLALETQLDVLVNNAGVLLHRRELSSDGQERSMAVNLLAPLRLTQRLLPLLAASRGRVINVSSGGQYLQAIDPERLDPADEPFDGVKAYARAKRALVSMTQSLAARHPGVGFHAMHPGWVATDGVARSLPRFDRVMKPYLRDARMGADTIVWLAAEEAAALGSGHFWLDRRVQPVDVLPNTALDAPQAQRLMTQLEALA